MVELVTHGRIDVEGRLVDASNATLFGTITLDEVTAHCVYKPVRGERPLWDFPDGTLAGREVATYLLSSATGADLVPPTVLRSGPFGEGMVQLWIDAAPEGESVELVDIMRPDEVPDGWRVVLHAHDRHGEPAVLAHADHAGVRQLAVFDAVANNADRKGGHVLTDQSGHVYGVDHGICLHSEPKLRTVLWGWSGEPLPEDAVEMLRKLRSELDGQLSEQLAEHLTAAEVHAITERTDALLANQVFPSPGEQWRAIPWPPF
ncbi:SCO1664 family protein [Tamaricihabitans halophyticus]|nr:SCO1664 family protein [Tamaricihabitans halophyticus]